MKGKTASNKEVLDEIIARSEKNVKRGNVEPPT
jgi:hypothetical protein